MLTKNKSGKSENRNSPLNPSKRSGDKSKKAASGQKEEIIYPHESEGANQYEGVDATFTERNDVTPPNKKEFPSVGPAKTDFASRRQGRTTGRMIGHEPGTEAI
jgi:hypothetical protein